MGKSKRKLTQHKTSGKGKRWRKGHSSSSNPTTSKFREAAKNRFFNQNTGPSALTEAALAKHNEDGTGGNEGERMSDITSQTDRLSLTAKTFNTWASNWTECTNTSFSRVHRYWQSNSAFHKEILAILAAVTEVIKAQGGKETETEYLGALMTALETSDNEQSLAAISYLISLVIKRVPMAVLRSKFSELAKKLLDYLGKHADGQSTSLLKSLITTLASLLRLQEQMVWNNSSTLQVYSGLLTFIVHSKPKVRKAAHRAICVILKGSVFMSEGDCPPHHPAASSTAKYCVQQIEECGGKGEALATLHTLALLRDILGWFPQHSLKSACETILRVMTLSNLMVTACCMQTLHGMFLSQPAESRLPAELNAQIITALYEYQPSVSDVQPMRAWLAVMEEGHVNLGRLQEKLCLSHLPRLVSAAMGCLLSDRIEVAETAAEVIKSLVTKCLCPAADNLASLVESSGVSPTPLQKIQQALEKGLGYQYHACWGLVLQIFSVYYGSLGKHCGKIMGKSLETIAELRESHKFAYKGELDHAVGCAIRTMGPRRVLEAIPLNITGERDSPDFPRSWLLPVLRENVQDTELGYFTSYFLPLAAKFKQKVDEMTEIGHSIQAKSYEALQRQIWSLLPRFCIRPTDLQQAFPGLAKVLGVALNDRPHLRMDILASLRKLILQNVDNDSARAVLSRFAKNYLPILFNLFTDASQTAGEGVKPAVLETIKVYMQIADSQLVNSMLVKCLTKMEEDGLEKMTNYNLLDLSIAMVPYADKAGVGNLYSLAKSHLNSIDKTLQKKCYRMLEEICSGKSVQCQEFVRGNVSDLKEILLQSLSSSGPSSKAPRLKCLVHVFRCLERGNEDFLLSVVPEAILCTKEIGERARLAGYSLLVEMAATLTRWSDKPQLEVLEQYFELLLPGLAGEHHMISATLLALSRLLYKFKDSVSDRLLDVLLENCCVLLESRQRDVLKSTLALIRVILASFTDLRLAHYLEKLVSSLVSLKEENRRHFRFDAKQIFVRLTRKFGYETIYNMVPESYKKVLVNIRKTQERAKKKSKERDIEKDEDETKPSHPVESIEELLRDTDSEPEDDNEKPKKMTKKANKQQRQKGDAWLKEDDQAEIMDFLDSSAAKRVMATKPVPKEKESKKSGDFKTTPDGRLIITGDKESDKGDSEDEDGLQDLLDAFESHQKQKGRKRKMSMDVDEDEGVSTTKYKAGGSGIHRPLGKPTKSSQKRDGTSSREIGADYRAKKAGGDIKKKGQPDPYAYVPLQMSNLNRRKQAKLKGQFSGFVRGAKKGAAKGTKAKQKSKH